MTTTAWVSTSVSAEPLDAAAIVGEVARRGAGALVEFRGVVRDHDADRAVLRLEYEGHPRASAVLAEVVEAVVARRPAALAVSVHHRIGALEIGDDALVAAASTAHRAEAFALVGDLVDEVKAHLPIWKHQYFADGTDEWVNAP